MKEKLKVPKENKSDYAHKFVKSALGITPFAGTALGELFSSILPPSIESRRNKWMNEVASILNNLIAKNENLIEDLKENEDFISLLLETSQRALKTHKDEKLKLFKVILENSIVIENDFFITSTYVRYIEELNPIQVSILDFIRKYQKQIKAVDSYQKFYNIFTEGTLSTSPFIEKTTEASTVRFLLQDLDKKGLILISESIGELKNMVRGSSSFTDGSSNDELPYIRITEFGLGFLKMVKEKEI